MSERKEETQIIQIKGTDILIIRPIKDRMPGLTDFRPCGECGAVKYQKTPLSIEAIFQGSRNSKAFTDFLYKMFYEVEK